MFVIIKCPFRALNPTFLTPDVILCGHLMLELYQVKSTMPNLLIYKDCTFSSMIISHLCQSGSSFKAQEVFPCDIKYSSLDKQWGKNPLQLLFIKCLTLKMSAHLLHQDCFLLVKSDLIQFCHKQTTPHLSLQMLLNCVCCTEIYDFFQAKNTNKDISHNQNSSNKLKLVFRAFIHFCICVNVYISRVVYIHSLATLVGTAV